jgi:hypothetical protein
VNLQNRRDSFPNVVSLSLSLNFSVLEAIHVEPSTDASR